MCDLQVLKTTKALRLEVHHAETFNDICKENNITTTHCKISVDGKIHKTIA